MKTTWTDYRTRRLQFHSASLGGFVMISLLALITQLAAPRLLSFVFPALGMLWMVAFAVTGFRVQRFHCPECDKPFFVGRWHVNTWARRCAHCGLPKWSESPPP